MSPLLQADTHMRTKILFALFLACILYACSIPSIEKYTGHWIGHNIEEIQTAVRSSASYASRIGWRERTYKLDNGNWVYVAPDSKNCFIHWEVNPQGIIVGYRLEGNCH